MADIQLEIEGPEAVIATEELLSISGISGTWAPAVEGHQREGVLITIAHHWWPLPLAPSPSLEKIYQWYQKIPSDQPISHH